MRTRQARRPAWRLIGAHAHTTTPFAGSARFDEFLALLGERMNVATWRAWKGTFAGSSDDQVAYYTAWRGFEMVFHVSTVLDAAKQRQHIGNDTVNIIFKHGRDMPECQFRGKVNACALVVRSGGGGGGMGEV